MNVVTVKVGTCVMNVKVDANMILTANLVCNVCTDPHLKRYLDVVSQKAREICMVKEFATIPPSSNLRQVLALAMFSRRLLLCKS